MRLQRIDHQARVVVRAALVAGTPSPRYFRKGIAAVLRLVNSNAARSAGWLPGPDIYELRVRGRDCYRPHRHSQCRSADWAPRVSIVLRLPQAALCGAGE